MSKPENIHRAYLLFIFHFTFPHVQTVGSITEVLHLGEDIYLYDLMIHQKTCQLIYAFVF